METKADGKRLLALDVQMADSRTKRREALVLFLVELAKRVSQMPPQNVEHLARRLFELQWQRSITDDVYRCVICGAQETHAGTCPVRTLVNDSAGQRAMARDPEFPDVPTRTLTAEVIG